MNFIQKAHPKYKNLKQCAFGVIENFHTANNIEGNFITKALGPLYLRD